MTCKCLNSSHFFTFCLDYFLAIIYNQRKRGEMLQELEYVLLKDFLM